MMKAATVGLQGLVFKLGTTVHGDGFAVLAHPHQVVAEVGFQPLLLKIQCDLRAADVVREHAPHAAVQECHPDHEAGNRVV
jgi:hypothetical protein